MESADRTAPDTTPGMHSEKPQAKEIACARGCGLLFVPKRQWQKFCSTKCRNEFHHSLTPEALRRDIDADNARIVELERRLTAIDDPVGH